MSDRLNKAIDAVPDNSAPEDTSPKPETDVKSGEPTGKTGDDEKKGEGRSIDNVRGELIRKLEKQDEEIRELRAMLTTQQERPPAQDSPPVDPNNRTLDQMSIDELKTAYAQLPENVDPAQKQALADYIVDRKIDEAATKKVKDETDRLSYSTQEKRANETAMNRWPELRKKGSRFYNRVNQILQDMGKLADQNPSAILQAANEAGLELGLQPATAPTDRRRGGQRTPDVATDSDAPVGDSFKLPSQEKLEDQARKLKNALPPGKEFNMDNIKKRMAHYAKDRGAYKKGSK
ncbi:MAG: hypothetical protein AMJ55_02990 [Gammaproteobacteria bacterium SG8_15]|nr:MAG: hypothetical protein AMJ55_02990 [Gammaproteobacteria bacterium SG8_15]